MLSKDQQKHNKFLAAERKNVAPAEERRYTVSKDRMNFSVVVRHNIDEALILERGVTDQIRQK